MKHLQSLFYIATAFCLMSCITNDNAINSTSQKEEQATFLTKKQYPKYHFGKYGKNVMISWEKAHCLETDNDGNRYQVKINKIGYNQKTDKNYVLIPQDFFAIGGSFNVVVKYYGKRLNRNGQCKGVKYYRSYIDQSFTMSSLDTFKRIKHVNASKCLYVYNNTVHNWGCWESPAQAFKQVSGGAGQSYFLNVITNKCVQLESPTSVRAGSCGTHAWHALDYVASGVFRLRNLRFSQCLIGHSDNGGLIQSGACSASLAQRFSLEE